MPREDERHYRTPDIFVLSLYFRQKVTKANVSSTTRSLTNDCTRRESLYLKLSIPGHAYHILSRRL